MDKDLFDEKDKKIDEDITTIDEDIKASEDKAPSIGKDGVIEGSYIDITEAVKNNSDFKNSSYYSETILNENTPKKKKSSFKRFIAGILIASIIGGPMIGMGINIAKPLSDNFLKPMLDNKKAETEQQRFTSSNSGVQATALSSEVSQTNVSPATVIAKNVGSAVVCITNTVSYTDFFNVSKPMSSSGSGIIFHQTEDKIYIVTNEHVISNSQGSQQSVVVTLAGDQKVSATLVGSDSDTDLAVLSVNKADMSPDTLNKIVVAKFGDSSELQVGELVVAIGNPLGEQFSNSVTQGIISGLDRKISTTDREYTVIQTDAAINEGNSGGALVNSKSEVIGINTVKLSSTGVEGMGFAIPTSIAKPIIEELMNKGYISRPALGIVMERTISEQVSQIYGLPTGVMIDSVIAGSAAEIAGLKSTDIITEFDGQKITSKEQLSQLIKQHKVGDIVSIKFVRNGRTEHETKVTLQDSGNQLQQSATQNQQSQQFYDFRIPFGY